MKQLSRLTLTSIDPILSKARSNKTSIGFDPGLHARQHNTICSAQKMAVDPNSSGWNLFDFSSTLVIEYS